MQKSGEIAALILKNILGEVKAGEKTAELEKIARYLLDKFGVKASFKTIDNYPFVLCVSVNEEVVHGLPGERRLKKGDLVSIDLGVVYQGVHSDVARTVIVKPQPPAFTLSPLKRRFLQVGQRALNKAIKQAKIGNRVGHISWAIQKTVEDAGYNVVRTLTGHGIGRKLHEKPQIPCFLKGKVSQTPLLREGMVLAIEVMYTLGSGEVKVAGDNWTVVTSDRALSAHFEDTVAITKKGPKILTR